MVVRSLVGVALDAESSREGLQQEWVVRSVWLMAFAAASASPAGDGIVFECEWPGDVSVARDALLLCRGHLQTICIGWVDRMAVAAEHPALWNRVVRVLAELRDLGLVTRVAEGGLVGLEQVVRLLDGGKNLRLDQASVATNDVRLVALRVDLVARDARDSGSRMRFAAPVRLLHQIAMAAQAGIGDFFGRYLRVADDLGIVVPNVERSRTVTGFAALLIDRQTGGMHVKGMSGFGEVCGHIVVALRALFVSEKIFRLGLRKQGLRKTLRLLSPLVHGSRQQRKRRCRR